MSIDGYVWTLEAPGSALVRVPRSWPDPPEGFALLAVLGTGVCHTDLGFADGEVAPKAGLPLVLGHEIVGRVLRVGGAQHRDLLERRVLAPAVSPCGKCAACKRGRPTSCPAGRMPGTTSRKSGPNSRRSLAISCAEQTTPSNPLCRARLARRRTWSPTGAASPKDGKSSSLRLVSMVTAITLVAGETLFAASPAARRREHPAHRRELVEIVVVIIENEATVKRFYPEGDRIRFQPANANMSPIIVRKAEFKSVDIIGIVVGVYRKL